MPLFLIAEILGDNNELGFLMEMVLTLASEEGIEKSVVRAGAAMAVMCTLGVNRALQNLMSRP